uniref:Odorant receptor n=1 Tax=Scaeva pyrastri TaxID=219539 RepID=A0A1B3B778_SCAPY|nr:putative odorant receptor OR6 [Scaeva pyrastri]
MKFRFLSPDTPIKESYLLIPRFSLRVVGCWPQRKVPTFIGILHFLASSSAVAFGAFGECIAGALTLNQILETMEAWCPGVTKQISLFKMWIFFVHREKLYSMIERIEQLLTADSNEDKKKIAQKLSVIASILTVILFVSANSTNLFFNTRPLINNIIRISNGKNATLDLPFKMILPDVLTHYPVYPLTYISMSYSGVMTVFTFCGVDGCFVGLCFYISALFRMIQYDIQELFGHLQYHEKAGRRDNQIMRQELKVIIRRHNEVIDLCNEFKDIFTTIIMGHFLSASLVVCFSVIDLLYNTGIGLVLYVCYSIAALSQLFLYCIGGTYVNDSSLEICDSVYLVEWYKCDAETRRMILMILIRAQRPATINVPFFTPSLPTFMGILSTTGSYIALMKSFL